MEDKLYLVLEYCDGGDLEAYRTAHGVRGRQPEATARYFVRQLAEGLKVLRGRNIVHRDLKPQNLLLSTNGDAITLKIGDFGLARSLKHENLAATTCGSPYYMAPEIWYWEKYDAKADLWSVGVILFQLVTGKRPFSGINRIEPGPKDFPIQCFIKRNKKNSMFYLYLGLSNATVDKGKFLMAARRFRRAAHTEYIISLDADDLSQGSIAYVGKLRSDFWGTNFKIYDSQPPYNGAKATSTRSSRRFGSRRISPQVSAGNFDVGRITYEYNLLKSRGPRRMFCTMEYPSTQETWENSLKTKSLRRTGSSVLRNKAPRWHEHLQCWCLNFHGRVTVASVKNFQLVATADPSYPDSVGDGRTVLLQFGKVDSDIFTMDYRQPLSAFQAFAICLSSFGSKLACE